MANPFDIKQKQLINLASGQVLPATDAKVLLEAEQLGEKQFSTFVEENLLSDEKDIFTKLKKNKLQTFSSRKNVKGLKGKEISAKLNQNFFARLLVVSKHREINLREVLSYSLGSFPLSLATPNGGLVKTAKSKLLDIVENEAENSVVDISNLQNTALIVDAMATLQVIKGRLFTRKYSVKTGERIKTP